MKRILLNSAILTLSALLAGCGGQGGAGGHGEGMSVKVKAVPVVRKPIEEKIALVASISANESVEVRSEVDGMIAKIGFEEGKPIEKGDLVAELKQEKIEASVAEAEASFKLAESNRARSETMLANNTISKQEFDQAVSTYDARKATLDLMKQQWKDTRIVAPFSGIAGARLVSPGQVISRSTPITTIVDVTPVKVDFRVPERFLGQLSVGQTIAFHVAAYPDEVFHGEVYFIDPQVDTATRSVLVKATQANEDGRLRPGMFGNLDLILKVKDDAVLIPESALVVSGNRAYVFIVDKDSAAQMVDVTPGIRQSGSVEITSGLQGNETVIVEGIQKIGPGAKVITDEAAAAPATP